MILQFGKQAFDSNNAAAAKFAIASLGTQRLTNAMRRNRIWGFELMNSTATQTY